MANSNKVTVDNLASAIVEVLQKYKEDIEDDVKETADQLSKEARKELTVISPRANRTVIIKGGTSVVPR